MTASFDGWLAALRDRRRDWVDANRRNDFDRGIRNATVEKYADAAHFVFELLQNAEDAGATRATFTLERDAVSFEHDGRPFERPDVEGVTGLGNTTKLGEANRIGCFGIGFKSVFVVTDAPEVHTAIEGRPVAFAIRDLVVPELIGHVHAGPGTLIRLPLAADGAAATLARVRVTLDGSGPRSLLFLSSLRSLSWTGGGGASVEARIEDDGDVRTLVTSPFGGPDLRDRFVILERAVERDGDARRHSVKAALRLNGGGEVVPEPGARLAVFFDTEDATGLQFQVHGPFQLTDNRANAKRDDRWNALVMREIGAMMAAALPGLRDRGMLTRPFLEVVPNAADELAAGWTPVRDAMLAAFRAHSLLPTHGGGHVPATRAVRGPADVREALGEDGLAAFAGRTGRGWATGSLRGSRAEALLTALDVAEFGAAELLEAFRRAFERWWQTSAARTAAQTWFDALPDDRVQRLYLLVEQATRSKPKAALATCEFVRLEDGRRVRPELARLPPAGAVADPEAATLGLVLVRGALVRGARGRGADVEQFLRRAGVAEIGERDYLKALLARSYRPGAAAPTAEAHLRHVRRVVRFFDATGDASILDGVTLLRAEGDAGYHKTDDVFLGAPFARNDLHLVEGVVPGRTRRALWSGYAGLRQRGRFLALLAAAGVTDRLLVEHARASDNPRWSDLCTGFGNCRVTNTGVNEDHRIAQLDSMLALSDPAVARMVFAAAAAAGTAAMRARWSPNQSYIPNHAPSQLAQLLRSTPWLPARDGTMRRPAEISAPELADGFPLQGNTGWLDLVGLGERDRQRSELHTAKLKAAQVIGLPPGLAERLSAMEEDARSALGAEMLRRIEEGAFARPEFPTRQSANPERREAKVAERARAAPEKTFETRDRSVRTSAGDVREGARTYLRDLYTNDADQLVCQGCREEMPFRLADGRYYFEAVSLVSNVTVELAENHLALCPTCAAKWRHARETVDDAVAFALRDASGPEIAVRLANEEVGIRFVEIHLEDVRTALLATTATNS